MGATEEQLALLSSHNVTHVSYILLLYSIAFLLFLFVSMLLQLYANSAWPLEPRAAAHVLANGSIGKRRAGDGGQENGVISNGHLGLVRDAEEFELEGLMTDDEGDSLDSPKVTKGV